MLEAVGTFATLRPKHVQRIDVVLNIQKSYDIWLDIISLESDHNK